MKILYCVTGLERGGAEAQVVQLALSFRQKEHEVLIVSLIPIVREWTALKNADIRVVSLGMKKGRASPTALYKYVKIAREYEADVVHSHMVHANIFARCARLLGAPGRLICTAHNVNEGGVLRTIMYRLTDWLADATTNVTPVAVAEYINKGAAPRGRIFCVPNGLDEKRYSSARDDHAQNRRCFDWPDSEFVWLAVGRFVEAKDYPNMLQALRIVKKYASTRWRVCLVGEGPLQSTVMQLSAAFGLTDEVKLLGYRDDIISLMSAADGFVMSSAWEGLPMVLLEASASGLPSVATDAGGSSEIVVSGKTGYIVPRRQPEALAASMLALMAMPKVQRERMGLEAKTWVARMYSLDRICEIWERAYHDPNSLRAI